MLWKKGVSFSGDINKELNHLGAFLGVFRDPGIPAVDGDPYPGSWNGKIPQDLAGQGVHPLHTENHQWEHPWECPTSSTLFPHGFIPPRGFSLNSQLRESGEDVSLVLGGGGSLEFLSGVDPIQMAFSRIQVSPWDFR